METLHALLAWVFAAVLAAATPAVPPAPQTLAGARTLLLTGHTTEARAEYQRHAAQDPQGAAIGIARCQSATGDPDGARATLRTLLSRDPSAAGARAELAALEFGRGAYDAAQVQVDSALALDPDQPAAHYVAAELHRVAGRLDEANQGYLWFVRFYNREQEHITDPEVMRWIGLAGAQNARWNRNANQFDFLVNTLYPDALKADSLYWPARLDAATLFIEKFNPRDATREIDAGLRIDPDAAELHVARALIAFQRYDLDSARAAADRALALQPKLVAAHLLRADIELLASGAARAIPELEAARAIDPVDEETLGRLAAVYGVLDGFHDGKGSPRMEALIAEALRRNPHCGAFHAALASSLDLLARYPDAARYYEEARRLMPQLASVPGSLGLVRMKLGDEARAREILKDAFDADPFNKRVRNSLDVLERLEGYRTIETPHFVIRYDATRDSALARQAADTLESVIRPAVVKALAYEPAQRTLIEIFSRGGRNTGHAWFSIRVVGQPFIGTVAASTGQIVAMTSPHDSPVEFEWARVLKHEFVHVVNMQQTDFAMPRWFTEGLAVRIEAADHPAMWDSVLVHRVNEGDLFDLDTIQLGFLRPSSGADWALAYYQAKLYVDYMAERFGPEGPARMIAAYKARLDTRQALKRSFGVEPAAFEQGYRAWISDLAARGAVPRRP